MDTGIKNIIKKCVESGIYKTNETRGHIKSFKIKESTHFGNRSMDPSNKDIKNTINKYLDITKLVINLLTNLHA